MKFVSKYISIITNSIFFEIQTLFINDINIIFYAALNPIWYCANFADPD